MLGPRRGRVLGVLSGPDPGEGDRDLNVVVLACVVVAVPVAPSLALRRETTPRDTRTGR
jgi:hypothetical protein